MTKPTQHPIMLAALVAILVAADSINHTFSIHQYPDAQDDIDDDLAQAKIIASVPTIPAEIIDFSVSSGDAHLGYMRAFLNDAGDTMAVIAIPMF